MAQIEQSTPTARRILWVDDEPIVRDSVRRVVAFDCHTVEIAADATEALALLQEFSFDLVITDFEMPGMRGDKLASAIKAILPMQPVLMISAYGEQLHTPDNPLAAVDVIVSKPFQIEELGQVVAQSLLCCAGTRWAKAGQTASQPPLNF